MLSNHTQIVAVAGNDDLLTQILIRLPIRSLLLFKSVSKHWLSLISNPSFSLLRNSLAPNPNPTSGLLFHRSSPLKSSREFNFVSLNNNDPPNPPFRTLNFFNDSSGITILQSCNGLLLCCCSSQDLIFTGKSNYYIYNPTTNKFTILPDPNPPQVFRFIPGVASSICAVSIAFEPSKSPHYKAVCVYESEALPQHYEIVIYSSETHLWTPSSIDPFHANVHFWLSAYWNGSIHWFSPWSDSLYFNLNTELIGTMPIPPMSESWEERRVLFLGESGGHLHLILIHGPQTTHFNLYEMETDYSKWFVKYHVDLDSIASAFPEMIHHDPSDLYYNGFNVLVVVRGEKDEDSFLVLEISRKAIRYNFTDKTFKKLCDFSIHENDNGLINIDGREDVGGWVCAYQFIESLASV